MQTHPILTKEGTRSPAFEVENVYIGLATIARLLAQVQGVTDVKQRKMFAKSSDVHVNFKYRGQPWIVWEPYGDNSRYWIGPQDHVESEVGATELEDAFKRHSPPFHRVLLGDLLTLRFITRFTKRG
jgi:hypothetical protein